MTEKTCIAVIPARGGSKRVPGKNVREFFGRPLLAYSIAAARDSGVFSSVVVSTDDPGIADVARQFGADVPFLRDARIADDHTPVSEATVDTLERIDPADEKYALVAQLMANCPLRTALDVQNSYRKFMEGGSDSQLSVTRYGWLNPWWAMRRGDTYVLDPLFKDEITRRSQDLPDLFCPTGAVWWAKTEVLRRERTFHVNGRTGWEIPWQRGIDIDTEEDWEMAELLKNLSMAKRQTSE